MNLRLLILLLATLAACRSKIVDEEVDAEGFVKRFDQNGVLIQTQHYAPDGEIDISRDYYRNGKLFRETHFVHHLQQGEVKHFDEEGRLVRTIEYDSGRKHGVERKYHKDGTLAFEAPYHKGKPCAGLKEYLLDGTLKTSYPHIVIKPYNKLMTDAVYGIEVSLSDGTQTVEFYEGHLTDGVYLGKSADALYPVRKGKLKIEYYVIPGDFIMKQLHIIAKYKTRQGNYAFTETNYNVSAENR